MPYRHFTTEERYLIAHMHIAEFSLREGEFHDIEIIPSMYRNRNHVFVAFPVPTPSSPGGTLFDRSGGTLCRAALWN